MTDFWMSGLGPLALMLAGASVALFVHDMRGAWCDYRLTRRLRANARKRSARP